MRMRVKGAMFVLVCVAVTHVLVAGDCEIKDPERCDLKSPQVVQGVQFNGTCNSTGVPTLVVGDTYQLNISFTPAQDAKEARSEVKVEVLSLLIPLDIENPNACVNKGLDCPLKADTNYTFNTVFDLKPTYPVYSEMHAKVHWSLVDKPSDQYDVTDNDNNDVNEDNKVIFCIKLPVVVEPKPSYDVQQDTHQQDTHQQQPSFRVVQ
ncbi:NPC intracellular cholesterol transporter 2 homolog a-like [Littorina saxatilis]|uniref:MD-2-related lipid-recognition domain-containing protein n=1 Tax=Littorina saxatilis TaxID=31220 RepID=A0AAN9GCE8_9CAEN